MKASTKSPKSGERVQVAALPVRIDDDGNSQVLLLTSRETKRWVIPKGWPMKGRKPYEAAVQEALEEAGKRCVGFYVVKPFSLPELMARVRALLRRSRPERVAKFLVVGDIDLDRANKRVRRGSRDIHLAPREFRLLEFLLERPGRVFSRAQLLDAVWGHAAEIDDRTVDVHIGRLRKALSKGSERNPIRTVRGVGYSLDETLAKS